MASLKQEKASISPIFLFYFERVHLIHICNKKYISISTVARTLESYPIVNIYATLVLSIPIG